MITSSVLHYKLQQLLKGKKTCLASGKKKACAFEDAQLTVITPQRLLLLCLPAENLLRETKGGEWKERDFETLLFKS